MIIRSIRHKGLKRLVEDNQPGGVRPGLVDRIRKILAALIVADDLNGFMSDATPGWRIHRLSGDRQQTWSVSVSGNWRITFEENKGELSYVDFEDYH